MKQLAIITAILTLTACVTFAGVPVKWDVRYGDSSSAQITPAFTLVTRNGDTTYLQPRFLSDGRPIELTSNSLVRAYFREYGSTNAYVTASATGTVYTTTINKGRVSITVLDSDYAATTNEFYVGVENDGMMFSPWGKLTVANGPGTNPTTNSNGRTIIDWDSVDQINTDDSGFVQVGADVANATNAIYAITVTGAQSNELASVLLQADANSETGAAHTVTLATALQPPASNGLIRASDVYKLYDSQDSTIFVSSENGTGTVWQIDNTAYRWEFVYYQIFDEEHPHPEYPKYTTNIVADLPYTLTDSGQVYDFEFNGNPWVLTTFSLGVYVRDASLGYSYIDFTALPSDKISYTNFISELEFPSLDQTKMALYRVNYTATNAIATFATSADLTAAIAAISMPTNVANATNAIYAITVTGVQSNELANGLLQADANSATSASNTASIANNATAILARVPYTGATADVDFGIYSLDVKNLTLNGFCSIMDLDKMFFGNSNDAYIYYDSVDLRLNPRASGGLGDFYIESGLFHVEESMLVSGNLELGAIADVEQAIDDLEAGYVPYSGALSNVTLGVYSLTANDITATNDLTVGADTAISGNLELGAIADVEAELALKPDYDGVTNIVADSANSTDGTAYAITAVDGTATVDRANGLLQSIDMSGNLVLDVVIGSVSYDSQMNLVVDCGENVMSYTANATNIVYGLSDISITNLTSIILYSPLFTNRWDATTLFGGE